MKDVLEDILENTQKDALEENYDQRAPESNYDSNTIVVNILQL